MISIIIIGRNEGWRLQRCLESVNALAAKVGDAEVLYIDSASTDGSPDLALCHPGVRVFRLIDRYNAAMARNVGAHEARGDVLFFIDGDMEVIEETFAELYSPEGMLAHGFVSGNWIDYNYESDEGRVPLSTAIARPQHDHFDFRTGGLFLIDRALWQSVGGMRNKLRRNQDFDLSVRLAARGTFLFRKGRPLAVHHTTSPRQNLVKMFSRSLSGAVLYRAVSMRDNLFNRFQWKYFLRTSYTSLLLAGVVLSAMIGASFGGIVLYLVAVAIRCIVRGQARPTVFLPGALLMIWNDLLIVFGLIVFWPREPLLKYEELKPPVASGEIPPTASPPGMRAWTRA